MRDAIFNVTPDFLPTADDSGDGSPTWRAALAAAVAMLKEAWHDRRRRAGATPVKEAEELTVIIVERLVDHYRFGDEQARGGARGDHAGAHMINDVRALTELACCERCGF